MNITDPLFLHCRGKPADVALAAPGTALNLMSYARLGRAIDNVCRRIIAAGFEPGQRVAVFIDDPLLHAIVLLALTRLGIVTISGRNRDFSWRFEIDAVIADASFPFPVQRIILADPEWITGSDRPLEAKYVYRASPDDLCRIFLTSGTTGDEKAVAVTHGMLAARIARQYLLFGSVVSFSSRIFMDMRLTTSLGFQLLIATLWRGGALFMTGEPQETVNALPIYKVQSMIASPGGLANFLDAAERRPQYECRFDGLWTGGSSVPAALSDRARTRLCANLTIAYGSTEATMVASMPAQFAAGIQGAAGYVFPGITVEIVDDNGTPLLSNKEGIVRIKSRFGADGYLGDPEETARVFRDGWFYPGDTGYLTKDNMLVISGRASSVVNLGGEKANPERIEEILTEHASVAQAAVVAIAGDSGIDELFALVVPRSYLDTDALREHCRAALPSAFVPAHFIAVPEIPHNDTGKIERGKLMDLLKSKMN